jgi:integrase
MILGELRTNIEVRRWLDNVNAAKNTELSYLQAMMQFTEFTNKTPDELLYEAEQEILSGMLTRQRKLKGYLISFRKSLQDKGLSDLTVQTRIAAVKSFYESYDIPVPKLKGERRRAITKDCNNGVPDKTDLQECLKVCDPLECAVMLTGLSSGLASNEIRALKLKDFKSGYDPETRTVTLHITRQKTHTRFITFLSPECSKAVWEYLAFRDREAKAEGQKRKNQLEKQRTTEESYLFIVRSVPDEYIETRDEELRKLSENAIIKMFRSISTKARKNTESGTYNAVRSHCMRKYYNSTLINSGCDSFFCEFTLGHTLDGTRRAYFQASPEKLKEQYLKFVPFLTIQKDMDITESAEFRRIKEENETLVREIVKTTVERQEIAEVHNRLRRMAERQLKSDFLNIEIAMKAGNMTTEEAELQKGILKIGFKIDIGEMTESDGNEQIEKLLNS